MKISDKDKMQAWVLFAAGALAGIANLEKVGKIDNECELAATYADEMLEDFCMTFGDEEDE